MNTNEVQPLIIYLWITVD